MQTRSKFRLLRTIFGAQLSPHSGLELHRLLPPPLEEIEILMNIVVLLHIGSQKLFIFGFGRLQDFLVESPFPKLLNKRFEMLQISYFIANVGFHIL